MPKVTKEQQLLEKLIRGGRTNLSEWFEKITDEFYEEQAIEERTLVETIQKKFYIDLTIVDTGKIYRWAEHVIDMLKGICEKCQESGRIIRFPSLMIWIVMYSLCPVRDKQFQEPTKFHVWRFKPFS